MSKSRLPFAIAATAAGGIGYYLFKAGGDPDVAQKQAEADAHRASAKIKSELPGRGSEAGKEAEKFGTQAGAKFDNVVAKGQSELSKAEAYAKDAKSSALKKIDEADRKVEAEAAKAKSSASGWFGGSK